MPCKLKTLLNFENSFKREKLLFPFTDEKAEIERSEVISPCTLYNRAGLSSDLAHPSMLLLVALTLLVDFSCWSIAFFCLRLVHLMNIFYKNTTEYYHTSQSYLFLFETLSNRKQITVSWVEINLTSSQLFEIILFEKKSIDSRKLNL